MKMIKGNITAPAGFRAGGIFCGIKASGKSDLALIVSDVPASAAGMFTSNKVKAAPVVLSMKRLKGGQAQAIIINSGSANACTGTQGLRDAVEVAKRVSEELGVKESHVLMASTGAIGMPLPVVKVLRGLRKLVKVVSVKGGDDAARAILTTDLVKKEIAVEININGKPVRVGGIAKGSGMINPDLVAHATMLAFITTDAKIKPALLSKALNEAVVDSFNMVTVDNDTSTNDTVVMLANGMSRCEVRGMRYEVRGKRSEYGKFVEALKFVCTYLAKAVAKDGEGATKLVEIRVEGALSARDARRAAKTIVGSNLFKAAVYGADPNWGRVMAALGYSGIEFDPAKVDLSIGKFKVVKSGAAIHFNRSAARKYLKANKEVVYSLNLNSGKHSAVAWGCDLSYDYVKINAEYHT
jgi:glutamate N-acetyltransferase/amino-acid N-acetyltransferase